MDKSDCSFGQLPFSKLFNTYIQHFEQLSDFYPVNPFSEDDLRERIDSLSVYTNRTEVVNALADFHSDLGIDADQKAIREKFADSNALVFVTGQQLGLYGGPLFTIYKTLTTILLAREWEAKLNRPVVPVFWMADEDHDFDEIASAGIPGYDQFHKPTITQQGSGKPVSNEWLDDSIQEFQKEVMELLPETEFSAELWDRLSDCYQSGKSYAQAFAQLMNHWFAKHGVLIAGSNTTAFKNLLKNPIKTAIEKNSAIKESLEQQSERLEQDFHRQVVIGNTQLFYLDEDHGRQKLDVDGDTWSTSQKSWTTAELMNLADEHPGSFSPNVFLRPVLQDVLFPTIGYVAGPGELAYYGQMKMMYEQFGLTMPAIVPRLSITLIESGIERIMEKLPFDMCRYNQRIEDLEKAYIEISDSHDIDGVFAKWASEINSSAEPVLSLVEEVDPTLGKTTGKVISGFENELNKLKGRLIRSLKQQEETQLKRIAKIKSQLFPDGLQERSVSPVFIENKYGPQIWDDMLVHFEKNELNVRKHHIYPLT